jgi:hypothetical protein
VRSAAVGALLAALGLAGWSGAATHADSVSLALRTYRDQGGNFVMVWHGEVSSGAGGEEVEILGHDCLMPGYRLFFAAKTTPGGSYEVQNPPLTPTLTYVEIHSGMTFRARWRGQLSAPVVWRTPTVPEVKRISARRWKVRVNPYPVYMNLSGKFVELQRLRSGRWVRYQRTRLVRKPNFEYNGATNHVAVFDVPARGLRLRAFLPTKSVAPCFFGGPSIPWTS